MRSFRRKADMPYVGDSHSLLAFEDPVLNAALWLPAAAVALHLCEEFAWPGGFAAWYRQYPPGRHVLVSARFLFVVNAVFVALALLPPLLGPTPRGWAFWLVVATVAAVNACFHIIATVRTRSYSPGVVTGVVLYLPLAIVGGAWLIRDHLVAYPTVAQAIIAAGGYQLWSTWTHRRHTLTPRTG
jgi:hypothetical protein